MLCLLNGNLEREQNAQTPVLLGRSMMAAEAYKILSYLLLGQIPSPKEAALGSWNSGHIPGLTWWEDLPKALIQH